MEISKKMIVSVGPTTGHQKKCTFKNAVQWFLCAKISTEKGKQESLTEYQVLKTLISMRDSCFKIQSLKIGINRQSL